MSFCLSAAAWSSGFFFPPPPAYEAYVRMMVAMEQDLGKRLLVESGYRSPSYQL